MPASIGSAPAVDDTPLRSALAAWNQAARTFDVDAMARVYTEDAVFFGGRPGLSLGRQGVRAYFASYRDVIRSTSLELEDRQLFQLAPDALLAQGYGRFRLELSDGRRTESLLRSTLVVVQRDGRWQLLQHHFSATPETPPIGTPD
jgi:uncharacterized protein (TIGR02246 family)